MNDELDQLPPKPGDADWVEVQPIDAPTDEAPEMLPSVERVSMPAARVALRRARKITLVEDAVDAMGGEAKDIWEYSTHVSKQSPLIKAIIANPEIGIDAKMVDHLFEIAKQVESELSGE